MPFYFYFHGFILTNTIRTPQERFYISLERDRIILELSPEATARDIREAFKGIKVLQKNIIGYDIKEKGKKLEIETKIEIAKGYKKIINTKRKATIPSV